MSLFDRFADWVAHRWSSAPWFVLCVAFVAGWLTQGVIGHRWTDDIWHLELNSPTTALTFLGVFLLHNTQHRFERAQNRRWAALLAELDIDDPVNDEGQQETPHQETP